ncbi:cysteine hydrolase [Luteimonas vadosa]|uniref:Cysteine hydrolase n=1 Tax=Luteimonas vadosa TaxID=1165507 RepID=A0ABP9DTG2_9GAMM
MADQTATRTVLLILDMVSTFDFEHGAALHAQALRIAPRIARLKARIARRGGQCIYVNDHFGHWQSEFSRIVSLASEGTGADIVEILRPGADDLFILKPRHSAFYQTPLPLLLAKLDARVLVVTGIAAEACVLVTALEAHMRDYRVVVPVDCVASAYDARRQAARRVLQASGLETRGMRSIDRWLAGDREGD